MKLKKELLHAIIDHLHFAISHQPESQQPNYKIRNLEEKNSVWNQKQKKTICLLQRQLRQVHVSVFASGRHSLSSLSLVFAIFAE